MILSSENEKQKALATSCYLRSSANLLVVVAILRGVVLDGQAAARLDASDLRRGVTDDHAMVAASWAATKS